MFCKECGTKIPDDAQFCPYCGEVLELEEKSQFETYPLSNKLEDDFDLHLDWAAEADIFRQGMRTNVYVQVAKITSVPVHGAEVQLSGPPQVEIVVSLRKIHPKKTTNKIAFPISANEPGLFTLTATLTSDAGHRIAFPFKIRVVPSKTLSRGKTLYPEETRTRASTYSLPTYNAPPPSTNDNMLAARIIFGLIGVVLLLAAGGLIMGGFGGFGGIRSSLPFGITLAVIGVVILAIVTKGVCCYAGLACDGCSGCDCDC